MARFRTARAVAASATAYDGIYFRNNLDCDGDVPSSGPYDLSPDIIQSPEEVSDPASTFGSSSSWDTSYNVAPTPGITNYYYVRGTNGSSASATANVSLYYTAAELIPFPQIWQNNRLSALTSTTVPITAAASGGTGVGAQPFVWNDVPSPADGSFYAFIARAVDSLSSGTDLPVITTWTDMSALLTQDLNFGFNTAAYVDADESSWYAAIGLTIPQAITSSGQVMLMLSSSGFSGTVGLIGDRFTSEQQSIVIDPYTMTDSTVTSTIVTLDPGFSSTLTLQYWAGDAAPASGSTITLSAYYIISAAEVPRALTAGVIDSVRDRYLKKLGISPTPTAILGSATIVVS